MQRARAEFLLIILLLAACNARAEIYKWVDAEGAIHYTDKPPANEQPTLEITGRISSYDSPEILPAGSMENSVTGKPEAGLHKPAKNKRVVMYSAPWCGVCKKAKKYFAENNISHTEYDIDSNTKAKADFEKIGGRGVPVILVGRSRMNGFSPNGFEQLYYGKE